MVKPSSSSSSSSCSDQNNNNVRKGVGGWAEEKDGSTFNYFSSSSSSKHKHNPTPSHHPHWTSLPRSKTSSSGPKRCAKNNCRLRSSWNNNNNNNNVRPDLSNQGFTQQEEELIIKLHAAVGSRWGLIAHQLPGRTENDIKNHWNTKLRKKLTEMGIDPITHKPFSQILADYGNIGGISRSSDTPKYIGTITRDLKKVTSTTTTTTTTLFPYSTNSTLPNYKPESSTSTSPSYAFLSNSHLLPQPHTMSSPVEIINHYAANQHTNNNNNNSNNTRSSSLDLLSQLQAISLVTQGTNNSEPNLPSSYNTNNDLLLSSISSTSPSSSSYNNINNAGQAANSPDQGFSWHDFLLDQEPFKPAPSLQAPQQLGNNNLMDEFSMSNDAGVLYNDIQAASNSTLLTTPDHASSFLEAMLDHEDDMFLTFPGLMEEPLY